MDDKRLQTEFDEYFKGANLPENMTADAKAQVKPRKKGSFKWFLRLAPVAAAFILIIAASVVFLNKILPAGNTNPDGEGKNKYTYYGTEQLNEQNLDAYSVIGIKGLEFVPTLAYSYSSNINLTAFYENENMLLAKAEISLLHNGYRHDAVLYAEFTDEYYCYSELSGYLVGEERDYCNQKYIFNHLSYDEGENVYTIYFYSGGVKYYLSVMTSEPNGYKLYFDFLQKN